MLQRAGLNKQETDSLQELVKKYLRGKYGYISVEFASEYGEKPPEEWIMKANVPDFLLKIAATNKKKEELAKMIDLSSYSSEIRQRLKRLLVPRKISPLSLAGKHQFLPLGQEGFQEFWSTISLNPDPAVQGVIRDLVGGRIPFADVTDAIGRQTRAVIFRGESVPQVYKHVPFSFDGPNGPTNLMEAFLGLGSFIYKRWTNDFLNSKALLNHVDIGLHDISIMVFEVDDLAVERQRLVDASDGIFLSESERHPQVLQLFDKDHINKKIRRKDIPLTSSSTSSLFLKIEC